MLHAPPAVNNKRHASICATRLSQCGAVFVALARTLEKGKAQSALPGFAVLWSTGHSARAAWLSAQPYKLDVNTDVHFSRVPPSTHALPIWVRCASNTNVELRLPVDERSRPARTTSSYWPPPHPLSAFSRSPKCEALQPEGRAHFDVRADLVGVGRVLYAREGTGRHVRRYAPKKRVCRISPCPRSVLLLTRHRRGLPLRLVR